MQSAAVISQRVNTLFQGGCLRQIGTPTLFAAVVLLLSSMMLLSANVSKLRDSFAWVQHSNSVLLQLADAEAKVVGVEMATRGYALTDDPAFLGRQKNERKSTAIAMDKLAALLGADTFRADRLTRLRGLITEREAHFAQLSGLGPGHAQDVAVAIRDPIKRGQMGDVHGLFQALRADELKVLAERQSAVARQAERTYGLAIGIVILAFAFSALGFVFTLYGRGPAGQRDFARGS